MTRSGLSVIGVLALTLAFGCGGDSDSGKGTSDTATGGTSGAVGTPSQVAPTPTGTTSQVSPTPTGSTTQGAPTPTATTDPTPPTASEGTDSSTADQEDEAATPDPETGEDASAVTFNVFYRRHKIGIIGGSS